MRKFFLALLGFALLVSCPAPELRYFKFINESEVTLTKLILTTPKNEKVVLENLEHKGEFTFEQLPLGKYTLKIESPKYVGSYSFTLTVKVPSCTVTLNKSFEIEGLPLDNMQFASDAEYRELEQKIDTVLEESRRASENAMYEYADMVSDYLPSDITVKYNGVSITTKEEFMAQVDNFGDFEITYKDDATEAEINNKFSVIMENYLANRPKPLQNMLALNGIEGATEDEENIYYEGNAIFKLDFESAEQIKYYCGIYGKRADKMGFALDSTPLWKTGYRYAFDKSYENDEAGKNFFREQLKKWLDVIDNTNYTIDQIIAKCEIKTGSAQYNLWHLGMYYLCKISKKHKGDNNHAGLSGLPGRLPWQFINLYSHTVSDNLGNSTVYNYALDCGTVLHEIGHNLGLMHEHQRWDVLDNIIYRESSIQWVRFKGKMSSMYDINSIMHYPEAEFRETGKQKYPIYDFYGNVALNGYYYNVAGYLSEIDKIFISTLYNPKDSSKHYLSDVPILDRVYIKGREGVNLKVYKNIKDSSFSTLTSLSTDVYLHDELKNSGLPIPPSVPNILFAEKGALELPGGKFSNRADYNEMGFDGNYDLTDKVYYLDGRGLSDTDSVDIYIKKFFWQELSCGYDIKEQGDYSVINVPLKEAVNSVDLRVQPPRGSALNYQFKILRDDVTLKSLGAKMGNTPLRSFSKDELALQKEFNISYIYNSNGVDIELGLKNGQSAKVDGVPYNGGATLNYILQKSSQKDINLVVNCDWSGTAQSYVIHLICLDEDALPNFMKVISDKGGKLLHTTDNFVDYTNEQNIIDIYKEDVNNACSLEIDLKVGQKLFYSYNNSSFSLMNSPIPVTLSENQTHLYLRLEYDNGFNTTVVPITLCFEKFDYYKLTLEAQAGGLAKPEWATSPIKNGFTKDRLQTNKTYKIAIKAVNGFKPIIPDSFKITNKQDLYEFQFDRDTTVTLNFEPLHELSFSEEIAMSPVTTDNEIIRCGTKIEATNSISVEGNFIYLREPNTSYTVTITKEEEKLGYLYKYQLWIGGDDPIIEIKGGTQYNGSLSKTFSGTQIFYRKLYALKGGQNSWDVGQPLPVSYEEPNF